MANTILTNDMIFKLTLLYLENDLSMSRGANRNYEKRFVQGTGETVRIGRPVRTRGRTTNTIVTFSETVEQSYPLTIDTVSGDDATFTQQNLSRDVTDFGQNYIQPRMNKIAQLIDQSVITKARLGFNQAIGSATAPINSYATVDNIRIRMEDMAIPRSESWYLCLNNHTAGSLRQGIVGSGNYFTPTSNEQILMRGSFGMIDDFQLSSDQNLTYFTTGTMAGTPVVDGANQTGTTVNLKGFTNSATGVLKAGDIIYLQGVNFVGPTSYENLGYQEGFVVQADVDADAGGKAAVTISPGIVPNDLITPANAIYQNVTNSPADGATVTCLGVSVNGTAATYREGYAFTSCGLTLAAPPQVANPGATYSKNSSTDTGITVGMNVFYNINTNTNLWRWDTYSGAFAYGDYGVRAISQS